MNYTDSCNLLSWKNTNIPTTIIISVLLLSIGGLPPFLGFIPKLLTFEVLIRQQLFGLTFFILLGALINLSYYINIVFNLLCPPHTVKKAHQNILINILLMITATCPFILLSPLIIYAMAILNKSQRYWNTLLYFWGLIRAPWHIYKYTYSSRIRPTRSFTRKGSTI